VKEALGFLMTREVAHQKSFEKALYAIEPNFPPGKMPADPRFASVYYNMSQGPGEMRGPWNQGADWDFVTDREKQQAVDGGSGEAEVALPSGDIDILKQMAMRTMSDPMSTPRTGAELGMSMQSAGGGTMAGQSGSAMGSAELGSKGGQLDDTGMSKPQDKGTAKGMKAMKK
jgi:Mn-containing catalase